jgi:uncharacterized phage protein gp47/JayE
MPFAVTDTGVSVQKVQEILDELEAAARNGANVIHPNLDVSATSIFGQVFAVVAEREALLQQLVAAVAQSFSPSASGQALAEVCLLTGTRKKAATASAVTANCTLTAGTTLPAGSRANVLGDTTAVFASAADVTNSTGSTAVFGVTMFAISTGAVRAPAGTLTVINTPVSGWTSVTNPFDATVGSPIETDPQLRLRRAEELTVQGSTELAAIVADVREVTNVITAQGFENPSDATNPDGLTPHTFEIVVWDGTAATAANSDVAQAIFNSAAAGIQAVQSGLGTAASGTAIDLGGASHTVLFSRAAQKTLYVDYTLVIDGTYPADGDAQLKAATVDALTADLTIGTDVIEARMYKIAFSIQGVADVTAIKIGFSASPTGSANLVVGSREIAVADTSRITVHT